MRIDQWLERTVTAVEQIARSQEVCTLGLCLTKSEGAAWFQAIMSLVSIWAIFKISSRERRLAQENLHIEEVARKKDDLEKQKKLINAIKICADDAEWGLRSLASKISGAIGRPPQSSLPRIIGLERTFSTLLTKDVPAEGVEEILIILRELSYSIQAIKETGKNIETQAVRNRKSRNRAREVLASSERLEAISNSLQSQIESYAHPKKNKPDVRFGVGVIIKFGREETAPGTCR